MCCSQPNWVEEQTIVICRSCGANKPINRPQYIPYTGPTYVPPSWIPTTNPYPVWWGSGQSIGKVPDGHITINYGPNRLTGGNAL